MISCGEVEKDVDCKKVSTFKDKLVGIYNKRKENQKQSSLYTSLENKIKSACERAAYDGRNCVYIMDLHLENLMPYVPRYDFIAQSTVELEDMVRTIVFDLGLDITEGFITWKNS